MIGLAQAAWDQAVKYGYERKQFGKYIGDNQKMGHDYAIAATKIECARLLTYNAARLKEEVSTDNAQRARLIIPRDDRLSGRRLWPSEPKHVRDDAC